MIKFNKTFLLIIGFTLSLIIFYGRVRPRIPKELPIILDADNVWIYIYLISSFSVLLILTVFSLFNKTEAVNLFLVSKIINESLEILYNEIRNIGITFFRIDLETITYSITLKLIKLFGYSSKFYLVTTLLPSLFVLILFLIDIFYFHKLRYFYLSLLVLLLPLFVRCYIYSLNTIIERTINQFNDYLHFKSYELNQNEDFLEDFDARLILDRLIAFKLKQRKESLNYFLIIKLLLCEELSKEYNISIENLDLQKIREHYENHMLNLTNIASFHHIYDNNKKKLSSWLKICNFSIYLFGWSFIIYTCYNVLPNNYFNSLLFFDNIEPFSDVVLLSIITMVYLKPKKTFIKKKYNGD